MKRQFSNRQSVAAGIFAACLAGFAATPSLAQGVGQGDGAGSGIAAPDPGFLTALNNVSIRSVAPTRLRNLEQREYEASELELKRLKMNDKEIRADIAEQLGAVGVTCGVRGFTRVGTTPEAKSIYEAACDDGPGYLLVNGPEPRATNCLVLAGSTAATLRRNPGATVGAQCTLPENQNAPQLIGRWARSAGVDCRIDQAEWIGSSDRGLDIYEVGCDGSEGYWLEQTASGWSLKGCVEVTSEGLPCRFTAAEEQLAWMRTRLVGTSAAACDVTEIRMIGVSSQGRHYETTCGAPDQGYVVRIADGGRVEDVRACKDVEDTPIGCTLTVPTAARSQS